MIGLVCEQEPVLGRGSLTDLLTLGEYRFSEDSKVDR